MSKSSSIVSMLFALVAAIITMFGFAEPVRSTSARQEGERKARLAAAFRW